MRSLLLVALLVVATATVLVRLGGGSSAAEGRDRSEAAPEPAPVGTPEAASDGAAAAAPDAAELPPSNSEGRAPSDGATFVIRGMGDGDSGPEPCAGARVELRRRWPPAPGQPAERTITADGRGVASFSLASPSLAVVTAEGHVGELRPLVHVSASHHDVTLDRLSSLRVRVLTDDGEPRPGVAVELRYEGPRSSGVRRTIGAARNGAEPVGPKSKGVGDMRSASRETFAQASALLFGGSAAAQETMATEASDEGTCGFAGLIPGLPLSVTVTDPVFGVAQREIAPLAPGSDRTVDVELARSGAIRLTVHDHAGAPLPDAEVQLFRLEGNIQNGQATVRSDARGVARFRGVRDGTHRISVRGWSPSGVDLYLLTADAEIEGPGERDLGVLRPEGARMGIHLDAPEGDAGGRTVRASFSPINSPDLEPGTFRYVVHDAVVPLDRTFQVWTDAGVYRGSFAAMRPDSRFFDMTLTHIQETLRCPGTYRFAFAKKPIQEPDPYLLLMARGGDFVMTGPQQTENVVLLLGDEKVESMYADISTDSAAGFTLRSDHAGRHRILALLGGRTYVHAVDSLSGQTLGIGDLAVANAAPIEFTAVWSDGAAVTSARARMVTLDWDGEYGMTQEVDFAFEGTACLRLPDRCRLVLEFTAGDRVERAVLTGEAGTALQRARLALRPD